MADDHLPPAVLPGRFVASSPWRPSTLGVSVQHNTDPTVPRSFPDDDPPDEPVIVDAPEKP